MCDYSLHAVASRPAKVGERLVSTNFPYTTTRGFAALHDPNTAVCLLPGTEVAFDRNVEFERGFFFGRKTGSRTARFRAVEPDRPHHHHDALELSDGQIVLLTDLWPGQYATVLQLPVVVDEKPHAHKEPAEVKENTRRDELEIQF